MNKNITNKTILLLAISSLVACGENVSNGSSNAEVANSYKGLRSEAVINQAYFNMLKQNFVSSSSKNKVQQQNLSYNISTNAVINNPKRNCGVSGTSISSTDTSSTSTTNEFSNIIIYDNCVETVGILRNGEYHYSTFSDNVNSENNINTSIYVNYTYKTSNSHTVENGVNTIVGDNNKIDISESVLEDKLLNIFTYQNNYTIKSIATSTEITSRLSGKLYHSLFGFVTVSTPENNPLVLDLNEFSYKSGQTVYTGFQNGTIKISYFSAGNYSIDADFDGDGNPEIQLSCNAQGCG